MDFLYKLYANEHFALILFVTIAILLLLFIIVLIAAIRDAKKTKIKELNELEKEEIKEVQKTSEEASLEPIVEPAKKEEPKEGYEFFTSEDEQSKTMDIVLDPSKNENSMAGLLNEFDVPIEPVEENSNSSLDELIAIAEKENTSQVEVSSSVVAPQIEPVVTPIDTASPETTSDEFFFELTEEKAKEAQSPVNPDIMETTEMNFSEIVSRNENAEFEETLLKPKEVVIPSEDLKEEEDFELPKAKDIELPKANSNQTESEVLKPKIDLQATGVIDFTNVESESYEINK